MAATHPTATGVPVNLTEIVLTVVLVITIALTIGVYRWMGVYTRSLTGRARILSDHLMATEAEHQRTDERLSAIDTRVQSLTDGLHMIGASLGTIATLTQDLPDD